MKELLNNIHCADCLEFMKQMPDECVDCVITDPPYNASNSKMSLPDRNYQTIGEAWDKDFDPATFADIVKRKLKKNGSIVVFCSLHLLEEYLSLPFKLQQILHWHKTNPFPAIAKVYTFSIEYILWFTTGSPYVFNKKYARTDTFDIPILNGAERTSHPSQKPLRIIRNLIEVHTNPGHLILDPFAGSGTTLVAAKQLGRNFIGVEIDPNYCEIAKQRLSQEVLHFATKQNPPKQQESLKYENKSP